MSKQRIWGAILLVGLLLGLGGEAWAQAQSRNILRIRKITGETVNTPEYKISNQPSGFRARQWFRVEVQYETAPEWVDEANVTFYVLMKNTGGKGNPYTLFRGSVDYVNIEKGVHKANIYMHPSTLARYGKVERVGCVIRPQGGRIVMESEPASAQRWWEEFPPTDGYLLNRMQTPFAMLNFDDYEAIKAPVAR